MSDPDDDSLVAESVDELPVAAAEAPASSCPDDPQAGSTASTAAQTNANVILGISSPRIRESATASDGTWTAPTRSF